MNLELQNHKNQNPIVKQFEIRSNDSRFKSEYKVLRKIKMLNLEPDNGGFPLALAARQTSSVGEIVMTNVGENIFKKFNIEKLLESPKKYKAP